MKKILFDTTIFDLQTFGGISRYFSELICRLKKNKAVVPMIKLRISNNEYAKQANLTSIKSSLNNVKIKGFKRFSWKLNQFTNSFYTNRHLRKGDFDIYHPTYYSEKSVKYCKRFKTVVTIYDMIHEKFPELCEKPEETIELKKQLIKNATVIVAISTNTKNDILTFYPEIEPSKIAVIHLGSSMNDYEAKSVSLSFQKFILFVGHRGGYKNFIPMLKTISPFLNKNNNIGLICIGGGSFNRIERELMEQENILDQVDQKNLSDEELKWMYSNALVLLFPSEYEGFGIPVVEAFECGCPVILPNLSSFTEIAKNAGLFYEKDDLPKINNYLNNLLNDEEYRNSIVSLGKKQSANFSWDKMATETVEIYQSI